MNGCFTPSETKHLSPNERQHYLRLGLCAPVDGAELERIVECGSDRLSELSSELDAVRDEHSDTVRELVAMNRKVKGCLDYVRSANVSVTAAAVLARVEELLT